jgi:hypothetical protein
MWDLLGNIDKTLPPAVEISVPEFIDPRFRENKPKTLVFSHRKRAFWACFRENCVYNFGHWYCIYCKLMSQALSI